MEAWMVVLPLGLVLYLCGAAKVYGRILACYGLYELFNALAIFRYLNEHGHEPAARGGMIPMILGIVIACVGAALKASA